MVHHRHSEALLRTVRPRSISKSSVSQIGPARAFYQVVPSAHSASHWATVVVKSRQRRCFLIDTSTTTSYVWQLFLIAYLYYYHLKCTSELHLFMSTNVSMPWPLCWCWRKSLHNTAAQAVLKIKLLKTNLSTMLCCLCFVQIKLCVAIQCIKNTRVQNTKTI